MSNNWSQDRYIDAFKFAAESHNGQKYPGTDLPYIVHITMVCMEIIAALAEEPDADGDLAVQCALLHDTIEDTDVTYELLKGKFGQTVAEGVSALTKNATLAKDMRMQDSLTRILQQPKEIAMVKLADRITNLQPPPDEWSNSKRQTYLEQAREILAALEGASPRLSRRLAEKIRAYEELLTDSLNT